MLYDVSSIKSQLKATHGVVEFKQSKKATEKFKEHPRQVHSETHQTENPIKGTEGSVERTEGSVEREEGYVERPELFEGYKPSLPETFYKRPFGASRATFGFNLAGATSIQETAYLEMDHELLEERVFIPVNMLKLYAPHVLIECFENLSD